MKAHKEETEGKIAELEEKITCEDTQAAIGSTESVFLQAADATRARSVEGKVSVSMAESAARARSVESAPRNVIDSSDSSRGGDIKMNSKGLVCPGTIGIIMVGFHLGSAP